MSIHLSIPAARDLIRHLADQLSEAGHVDLAEEALAIAAGMYRRRPALPRAPKTSARVTAAMIRQVREIKKAWPRMSHQMLAEKVGTNAGRVSEIFHGEHDHLLERGK